MSGLFTHPDGAFPHRVRAGRTSLLTAPLLENGVTVFRDKLYVCLPLDASSDEVLLATTSALRVRFDATTVSVYSSTTSWVVSWQEVGDTLTVELKYPAQVQAVDHPQFARVELFRVDGEAVADEPTVTASTGAVLGDPFSASRFEARFSIAISGGFLFIQQTILGVSATARSTGGPHGSATSPELSQAMPSGPSLRLAGTPSSPRLRLLDPSESEVLWQWIEPGEHATQSYAAEGEELAAALAPAFERAVALERQRAAQVGASPAPLLALPLFIESDAPCRVTLQAASIEPLLSMELLSEPTKLSFEGDQLTQQQVALPTVPEDPVGVSIQATLVEREPQSVLEPPTLDASTCRTGVALEPGTSAAVLWNAEEPLRTMGFAVGFRALSRELSLALSLLPDAGGRARATAVAEGSVELESAGIAWVRFRWEPVDLQPGRYWVQLAVTQGSGLWLGTPASTLESVSFRRSSSDGAAPAVSGVPLSLLRHPLEAGKSAGGLPDAFLIALNGTPFSLDSASGEQVSGGLDIAGSGLGGEPPWILEARSARALDLTLKSVRVTYRALAR